MKFLEHVRHTKKLFGLPAEDIHKWIDGFFDAEGFDLFLRTGRSPDNDLYNHRQFRHCVEALEDAYKEFEGKYSRQEIKNVFETHLMDDYDGYLPHRIDFFNGTFAKKYHKRTDQLEKEKILGQAEIEEYFKGNKNKNIHTFKKSNFNLKIVLPTLIAIFLFVLSIFTTVLPVIEENMMEQKKITIKELTASAISIINHYVHLVDLNKLGQNQAMEQAIYAIKEMRYGEDNKDYFWITDMTPKMVMHPYRPDLVGDDLKNYSDSKNISGKKLFVDAVNIVKREGEGFLQYRWQWKDDPTKTAPKLSYVKGVSKWNWIVGTGIYINDVEEELSSIKVGLGIAFFGISIILFLIVIYLIFQSHQIELERQNAQNGLEEAKERYRVLVEGSNEGYILETGGNIIYSNHALQLLLEYSEDELSNLLLWTKIIPDNVINADILTHINLLFRNNTGGGEFEGQLVTKSGRTVDVLIATSKIFFAKKNGHVISFRPIVGKKTLMPTSLELITETHFKLSSSITDEISAGEHIGGIIQSLNRMPILIREMLENGTKADNLRRAIGTAYDAAINRFIEFAIEELGPPPVKFSFLSLGSNARHEMTMFSDQDNALLFEDVDENKLNDVRRYFLNLSSRVCRALDQAGYPYCPGDIMAVNPRWCLCLSEWKREFHGWIKDATPESILEINVFFDIHNTYGDEKLFDQLDNYVYEESRRHPVFFAYYARNCLLYRPPLNLFGGIKTSNNVLNLKECLRPIELFARIYALKYEIKVANTIRRLHMLVEKKVITEISCREMEYVFDHIWNLRFISQIDQHTTLRKVNDKLDLSNLTDIERQNLKNALAKISSFQTMMSYDFFGTPVG